LLSVALFSNRYAYDFGNQRFRELANLRVSSNRGSQRAAPAVDEKIVTVPLNLGRPAYCLDHFQGMMHTTLERVIALRRKATGRDRLSYLTQNLNQSLRRDAIL
jgi:hypothetical protein